MFKSTTAARAQRRDGPCGERGKSGESGGTSKGSKLLVVEVSGKSGSSAHALSQIKKVSVNVASKTSTHRLIIAKNVVKILKICSSDCVLQSRELADVNFTS